jgi:hypothetical protein
MYHNKFSYRVWSARWRYLNAAVLVFLLFYLTYTPPSKPSWSKPWSQRPTPNTLQSTGHDHIPLTVILAAIQKDNLTLLAQDSGLRHDDTQIVYVADDANATNSVPINKGNEAMIYVTYLIDHYDSLPDLMVFMHVGRTSWHNNVLLHVKSASLIQRLRRSYARYAGFVNLRCDTTKACTDIQYSIQGRYPASVFTRKRIDYSRQLEVEYAEFDQLWEEIFPGQVRSGHSTVHKYYSDFTGRIPI